MAQRAQMASGRKRVAAIVIVAWLVIAAALFFALGPDTLVIGEIGLACAIAFAVFRLLPMGMVKSELAEMFDQYAAQIDALEEAGAPLPACAGMEELVPAIDYATALVSESA